MKHLLKLSGSLLLDQFVGIISGFMLVLCVAAIFENSFTGYLIAFCICFGFYFYVSYHSAFKSGFHDSHRAIKDKAYRGYLYRGAISGVISALPLLGLYIACVVTKAKILAVYYMIAGMYWTWPMSNMFPNHMEAVMLLIFVPVIVIPWIGYIAGYKNFMITDIAIRGYKKMIENMK